MKIQNIGVYIQNISCLLSCEYKDPILCQQYAWWLLQKLFNKTKSELITQGSFFLTKEQEILLQLWCCELTISKKPIQYILGSVPFNGLDILVEPPILIPRPETEEWCWDIISRLKKLSMHTLKILDIATGTGCVGLALAQNIPQAYIVGTDISDKALALARKNSIHNRISNMQFLKSDVYNTVPKNIMFDLIVSNPPYIAESERAVMDESVLKWEDHRALFSNDNGLEIIKKIIKDAPCYLQQNNEMKSKNIPQIIIEIGYQQGSCVKQLMLDAGYNQVHIHKDIGQKDRYVAGRVDSVANSYTRK